MRWARDRCCTHPRERQRVIARIRAALERLPERKIQLPLDALESHTVQVDDADHATNLEPARDARTALRDAPTITEIEALALEHPKLESLSAGADDELEATAARPQLRRGSRDEHA